MDTSIVISLSGLILTIVLYLLALSKMSGYHKRSVEVLNETIERLEKSDEKMMDSHNSLASSLHELALSVMELKTSFRFIKERGEA